jgi:enoyl-CoA hydratase
MSSETANDAPRVRTERVAQVGYVTFDNPAKHNAMTFDMWQSLPALLQALDDDPAIRVIVLRGQGPRAFVSGSDISQFGERRNTPEGVTLYNATVDRAVASLGNVRKPTMAWIQGYCYGGGIGLALHCDLRYASADSAFSIPAGKVGLGYHELWMQRLAVLVGPANAKEIMFTARRYDSANAMRMGLVNDVLPEEAVADIVRTIASLAPLTHLASKLAIDTACRPLEEGRQACQAAIRRCFDSQDYVEGRTAFVEKRQPAFQGL